MQFLPANPALLGNNMNAGERINLRLRPPGNTSTFYEYDQLVLVMLHEVGSFCAQTIAKGYLWRYIHFPVALAHIWGLTVLMAQLTHIEQGPHDARFYKILGELEEEFYELKRKGYAGMSCSDPHHGLSLLLPLPFS